MGPTAEPPSTGRSSTATVLGRSAAPGLQTSRAALDCNVRVAVNVTRPGACRYCSPVRVTRFNKVFGRSGNVVRHGAIRQSPPMPGSAWSKSVAAHERTTAALRIASTRSAASGD